MLPTAFGATIGSSAAKVTATPSAIPGAINGIGETPCGSSASLFKSLARSRYGCSADGPGRPCKFARSRFITPCTKGASATIDKTWASSSIIELAQP